MRLHRQSCLCVARWDWLKFNLSEASTEFPSPPALRWRYARIVLGLAGKRCRTGRGGQTGRQREDSGVNKCFVFFSLSCLQGMKPSHLSRRGLPWSRWDTSRWSWRPGRRTRLRSGTAATHTRPCLQGAQGETFSASVMYPLTVFTLHTLHFA